MKWLGIFLFVAVVYGLCSDEELAAPPLSAAQQDSVRRAKTDREALPILDSVSVLIKQDRDLWRQIPAAKTMLAREELAGLSGPLLARRKALLDSVTVLDAIRDFRQKNPATRKGYVGCLTEDLFSQFTTLLAQKDERGMLYLIENGGCVMMQEGLSVSVLDRNWSGAVRLRVYVKGTAAEVWTFAEAVDDGT